MLSNNFPTTFLVKKSDFLLVSARPGLNFNTHSMYYLMEGRATSFNDLCTASTKALVEQMYINKIWKKSLINTNLIWRRSFKNMFTSRCNSYVTFIVANNIFLNNFKYPFARKTQSNFGRLNKTFIFIEMVFLLRLIYLNSSW